MPTTEQRECGGKIGYEQQSSASRHARALGLRAYRCSFCGLWHVGHGTAPPPAPPKFKNDQKRRRSWRRDRKRWLAGNGRRR